MNPVKAPDAEPIPGYRLIEPLGGGGFGEVWKCEAPGGLFKAVKFVRGDSDDLHNSGPAGAEQELRALQHIKSLRHPFLLSMDRVERIGGELVIVMELADRSLHDLLCQYRDAGLPGVPRAELLRYFEEAAEVLDVLNQEHGLQHLDVKPRNLFLVGRHVKVGDFGLVNSLAEMSGSTPSALQMGAGTPVYAAPECFLGKITLFTDQYSLAITYHELLTGEPPFLGKNFRQLALQHMQAEPDLGLLPASDRAALARRWPKTRAGGSRLALPSSRVCGRARSARRSGRRRPRRAWRNRPPAPMCPSSICRRRRSSRFAWNPATALPPRPPMRRARSAPTGERRPSRRARRPFRARTPPLERRSPPPGATRWKAVSSWSASPATLAAKPGRRGRRTAGIGWSASSSA